VVRAYPVEFDHVAGEGEPGSVGDLPRPGHDLGRVGLDGAPAHPARELAGDRAAAEPVAGLPAAAADDVDATVLGEHAQVPVDGGDADSLRGAAHGVVDLPGAAEGLRRV